MDSSESPALPTGTPTPAPAPIRLTLSDAAGWSKKWIVELHPQHLAYFEEANPQPYIIPVAELAKKVELNPGLRVLMIRSPRRLNLKLGDRDLTTIAQWQGPLWLEGFCKHLRSVTNCFGVISLVTLISVMSVRPRGFEENIFLKATTLQIALGVGFGVLWFFCRLNPRPVHLAVGTALILAIAAILGFRMFQESRWLLASLLLPYLMLAIYTNIIRRNLAFFQTSTAGSVTPQAQERA